MEFGDARKIPVLLSQDRYLSDQPSTFLVNVQRRHKPEKMTDTKVGHSYISFHSFFTFRLREQLATS